MTFALLASMLTGQAQDVVIRRNTTTTTTSTTTVTTRPAARQTAAKTGTLKITSTPADAAVKIDGQYMGTTPLVLSNRKTGTCEVTVSAEGYVSQTRSVTVSAGKTATCNVTLQKKQTPVPTPSTTTPSVQPTTPATPTATASQTFTVTGHGKTVTFKMIKVEPGTFQMGKAGNEDVANPVHSVTLTKAYYMGETEVTQALWYAVMGQSPTSGGYQWEAYFGLGDNYPAYRISYEDCQQFLTKLNQITGKNFRFPTEAEWEFAAKGGNKSKGYTYAGSNTIGDVAWYWDNSGSKGSGSPDYGTHEVKTKAANELGLYDMSGNVWERCYDWHGSYSSFAQTDPTGPATGSDRVNRGGGWNIYSLLCRVADRYYNTPSSRVYDLGLRLAL